LSSEPPRTPHPKTGPARRFGKLSADRSSSKIDKPDTTDAGKSTFRSFGYSVERPPIQLAKVADLDTNFCGKERNFLTVNNMASAIRVILRKTNRDHSPALHGSGKKARNS